MKKTSPSSEKKVVKESKNLGLNNKVKSKFEKTNKSEFVEDLGNTFYDREDFISRLVDKVESLDICKSRGIYHRISDKPGKCETCSKAQGLER